MKGHQAYLWHIPKHFVDVYKESIKQREKNVERNYVDHIHIDTSNSFSHYIYIEREREKPSIFTYIFKLFYRLLNLGKYNIWNWI